jgi:polysaccharide biosynthesis transport protein
LELREYWVILTRRWQLIGVVTALTLAVSALMIMFGPNSYKSELRLAVSIIPEPKQGEYYTFDHYYTWLTAEYLVDDLGEVIRSDTFLNQASQLIGGRQIPKEQIRRDISTKKTHRILTITVTDENPYYSYIIANAIKDSLNAHAKDYFGQLNADNAMIRVLDEPAAQAEMGTLRKLIEVGLRTVVGFLAALALAFLLNYLDPTVRNYQEAERLLGLPVLAELPR